VKNTVDGLPDLRNLRQDRFVTQPRGQNPPHPFHDKHRGPVDRQDAEIFAIELNSRIFRIDAPHPRAAVPKAEGGMRKAVDSFILATN
jgi:hypothetical protein